LIINLPFNSPSVAVDTSIGALLGEMLDISLVSSSTSWVFESLLLVALSPHIPCEWLKWPIKNEI
jgi:hypothetical protein